MYMEAYSPQTAKSSLMKEGIEGRLDLQIRSYYKTIVVNSTWGLCRDRHEDQWNRQEVSVADSCAPGGLYT